MELKKVELYTDGACSGNPGPGGYCAILKHNEKEKILKQGYTLTTNNRMELLGAIVGLEAIKFKCKVILCSDSKYLIDSIQKGWVYSWRKKNWTKSDGNKTLNIDLWQRLLIQLEKHEVEFIWIKGHDGHPMNERCDKYAVEASKSSGLLEDTGYVQ